jgi:hypothetical protein
VNLIAILSWYDEQAAWLAGVVASLAKLEVNHLIAVDGAYALYPKGRPYSGAEQHQTIVTTARALDIGCTISTPREVWFGNEVEKRNHAFALAETVAEPNIDWYFIIDADTFVTNGGVWRQHVERSGADVAEVTFREPYGSIDTACGLRCMFRAIPGLRFDRAHFIYRTPDGRDLHDNGIEVLPLPMIEVEHRTMDRDPYRKELQNAYYKRRDELGVEIPDPVRTNVAQA